MKLTCWSWVSATQLFLAHSQCATVTTINKTLSSPEWGATYSAAVMLSFPPQAATNLLPVPLDLLILEILYNNRIIRYVIFDFCVTRHNIFRKTVYVRVSDTCSAHGWRALPSMAAHVDTDLLLGGRALCVNLCPSFWVKAYFHSSRSFLSCFFHFEETVRMSLKESPSFCIYPSLVRILIFLHSLQHLPVLLQVMITTTIVSLRLHLTMIWCLGLLSIFPHVYYQSMCTYSLKKHLFRGFGNFSIGLSF